MNDGEPTLGVGFAIETSGSFDSLLKLQAAMNSTEGRIIADVAKVEKAVGGMLNFGPASARVSTFGSSYEREMQQAAASNKRVENSAESMIRSLSRQAQQFGKTSGEVRLLRAEEIALAAESRGMTEVAARLRAVSAEMEVLERSNNKMAAAGSKNAFALKQTALQLPDIIGGLMTGQKPMTVLIQQGGQIAQVAQMAEGGIAGFARSLAAAVAPFAPFIAAAGLAVGAFALFDRSVSAGVDTKKMIDGLGLTRDEIKKLKDTSVTTADVVKATFEVMAERVGLSLSGLGGTFAKVMDWLTKTGADAMAGLYAGVAGTFDAIGIVASRISKRQLSGTLDAIDKQMTARFDQARGALNRFGADVTKQIGANKLADLTKQAAALKADRTPKSDKHAQSLERENEAIEAQIRNLYAVADAYRVSGAAALLAEARVKAESDAIKKRGDIELFVARQVRLAIAQRVSDAAKSTAAMRDQAAIQELVNKSIRDGTVPAGLAAEMVKDRIADLPLLAALQAAQVANDIRGSEAATKALEDQRGARLRLADAERAAQLAAANAASDDQIALLKEELRLIGATDAERVRSLALMRATQEANAANRTGPEAAAWVDKQVQIAVGQQQAVEKQRNLNDELSFTADSWDLIARNVQQAASGMADAFGDAGRAIGDMAAIYASFHATRARLDLQQKESIRAAGSDQVAIQRENRKYALATATAQIGTFGDMAAAARGFFSENSAGYAAMTKAVQVFRAIEFALSVKAMAQDAIHTASSLAKSAVRTAAHAVEAVAKAIASLPFPANLVAGAATIAALAAIGVSVGGSLFGGGGNKLEKANDGTGTVLGDPTAKSESIKRAIDALKDVDTTMLTYSRSMAASMASIDSQIGGVAAQIVKGGNLQAAGVNEGFKTSGFGSILSNIPLIGGFLSSLFGSTTTVQASGLYATAQTLGQIMAGGFNASLYSDVQKKSKFFGITTGTSYYTQYSAADTGLTSQFTLLLKSFNDAIRAAAGPLGVATGDIENRLNSFVVSIGKIDLKGLSGSEIEAKLSAVFGAAADQMAAAAVPGITRWQKVGEGAFETLVRVSSTVETVTATLDQLGLSAKTLGIDAKMGLASKFDSISAMTSASDAYLNAYYTKQEQAASKAAQFQTVFASLGLSMPASLAAFRQLVEAQDLTTDAGRSTYATLLKLAPAFADVQAAMEGAKSAADIVAERTDLQRQLLQLQGDTAALRAMDLAKLDASNRALQQQVWAVQDAQEAAKAAKELADSWKSVGDSIMDEVKRIRGLTGSESTNFATLMGQFNAATLSARGGDQDAAKLLPGLSQSLLSAAANAATSRQELARVQAQTAASLEDTYAIISKLTGASTAVKGATASGAMDPVSGAQMNSGAVVRVDASDTTASIDDLKSEVAQMRTDLTSALATIAGNTGRAARKLDDVTAASGGEAVSIVSAAA